MQDVKEFEEIISLLVSSFDISKAAAKKIALSFLTYSTDDLSKVFKTLLDKKSRILNCAKCGLISNNQTCNICNSNNRESKLLIVDNSNLIEKIEQTKTYNGKYFCVPFLFNKKLEKIKKIDLNYLKDYAQNFDEIILAISPTAIGILTSQVLIDKIKHKNIKQLSIGIPFGIDIKYNDKISISEAIKNRKDIE